METAACYQAICRRGKCRTAEQPPRWADTGPAVRPWALSVLLRRAGPTRFLYALMTGDSRRSVGSRVGALVVVSPKAGYETTWRPQGTAQCEWSSISNRAVPQSSRRRSLFWHGEGIRRRGTRLWVGRQLYVTVRPEDGGLTDFDCPRHARRSTRLS